MAELGFKTINEMVGQVDCLERRENITHWKFSKLDLSPILYKQPTDNNCSGLYQTELQDHGLDEVLDWQLLKAAAPALKDGTPVQASFTIRNIDRTAGTILSNEITKKYKAEGLPEDTIKLHFSGTAGQSFGAFNTRGVTLELEGDANDYIGKGLSGAKIIVYPSKKSSFVAEDNIIIGNTAFIGATSGEAYIRGKAGERFCVRNSGAKVVVEGVGDHGCEYMTGGTAVILGETGRNFAAGMSGGVAYIYDVKGNLPSLFNAEMADLEPLDEEDIPNLKTMIEQHLAYTGSKVASFIISDWENQLKNFVKAMPRDYKKVLMAARQKAAAAK
jgi:glutamate synthase (NADPH/NADH) large chain